MNIRVALILISLGLLGPKCFGMTGFGAAGVRAAAIGTTATIPDPNLKSWMKCVSTSRLPSSGGTAVTADATNGIGVIFSLETNNGNAISADTFLLNGQGQKIKQIGHSEVLSANAPGSFASSAVILKNSSDSPFPMALVVTPVAGSTTTNSNVPPIAPASADATPIATAPTYLTGALSSEGLFSGQTLTQVYLRCRLNLPKTSALQ